MFQVSKFKTRGYTLLETVVYVSILAVVIVLVIGSILSVYQAFGKTRVERKLVLNGDVAMERIVREIRSATSTNVGASTLGSHPGILKFGSKKFSLSGDILTVEYSPSPAEDLTSSDVEVTNLIFYREASTNSEIIKAELTLEAGSGIFKKSRTFYGSAVMRGAY